MRRHLFRKAVRASVRIRQFALVNILHANDPPHRLALGLAIGVFITFTPTIGLQMLLVVGLAWLLRANATVGVPLVWISNPATFAPIYYPGYWLGRQILGTPGKTSQWWVQWYSPPAAGVLEVWKFYWGLAFEIAAPLWLGCLVLASVSGAITYVSAYQAISIFRAKAPHFKDRRRLLRRRISEAVANENQLPRKQQ